MARLIALCSVLMLALAAQVAVSDTRETPRRFNLQIDEQKVFEQQSNGDVDMTPLKKLRVIEGDQVELHWLSIEPVELHLHGYDIELMVEPGLTAVMRFKARATGRFPVTTHGSSGHGGGHHNTLLYFEVYPK